MGRPPTSFHGFWGQHDTVRILKRHVRGSKVMSVPIDNILLLGESGSGKTTLGKAIAAEAGAQFHYMIADAHVKNHQLGALLESLYNGDVKFIDEIQNLSHEDQISLCGVMDASKEAAAAKKGSPTAPSAIDPSARRSICVIAATDRPGKLIAPLFRRFSLQLYLDPYSIPEMTWIGKKRASEYEMLLTNKCFGLLARCSRGLPRLLGQRLSLLQRYWAPKNLPEIRLKHVLRFLQVHGIDSNGLDKLDRAYLKAVATCGDDGATLRTLSLLLNVDSGFLAKVAEPRLVFAGFLKVGTERHLTQQGRAYLEAQA